jgi:hypothetical protein
LALIGDDPGYPADGQYLLTASFTLSNWVPICDPNNTAEFTGEFDGNGNTILVSGFSAAALAGSYLGIFAVVGDGTASNASFTLIVFGLRSACYESIRSGITRPD